MEQHRMDYHLHSTHSFDGVQSLNELCAQMTQLGVAEICLTEHIEPGHPDPTCDIPPMWDVWMNELRQMRGMYPQLTIRAGVEIGDNPAYREQTRKLLDSLELDYHLLSLHLVNGVDCYEAEQYYTGKTRAQAYREYAEAKAESVCAWTDFDAVAHIGYVSRYSPWTGEEKTLKYEDAPDAFDAILCHIVKHGKCLEINASTWDQMGGPLPHTSIIRRYLDLGGELFTFGSDAHRTEQDYRCIEDAKELVRSLGGKYQAAFCKRRQTIYLI